MLKDKKSISTTLRAPSLADVPVLMLTARDMLSDKLDGFDVGADDYLVKPFALQELGARIEVLSRRGRRSDPETIRVADLELHPGRFEVFRKGRRLKLNPTGFRLLRLLMEASPQVLLKADLERELWGDAPPDSDALRSHIYALRRTVDRGFEEPLLYTVHGVGYRLDPDGRSSG